MKTVVSVLVGIMKIFFVGFVLAWTFVMNIVGLLVTTITASK